MGQPITVVEKQSSNPAVLRFETNRPLSGMGHERYTAPPSDLLDRPVDELARRLFAAGGVTSVHIQGSMVTVGLDGGRTGAGLGDIVRGLFLHYDTPLATADGSAATVTSPSDDGDRAPEATADPPAAEAAVPVDAATTEPGSRPPLADQSDAAAS